MNSQLNLRPNLLVSTGVFKIFRFSLSFSQLLRRIPRYYYFCQFPKVSKILLPESALNIETNSLLQNAALEKKDKPINLFDSF